MDGDVSDDGYWQLQNGEWVPTEKQVEALQGGATPHNEVSQQQPPQMVNLGMTAQPMTIMMPQKEKSPLVMVFYTTSQEMTNYKLVYFDRKDTEIKLKLFSKKINFRDYKTNIINNRVVIITKN